MRLTLPRVVYLLFIKLNFGSLYFHFFRFVMNNSCGIVHYFIDIINEARLFRCLCVCMTISTLHYPYSWIAPTHSFNHNSVGIFFFTFTLRLSWKVCHGLKIEKDGEDMWEGECGMKLPGRLYKTEVFHKYINLFVILAEWVAVRRAVHIHTYTFGRTHNGFSTHQHSCCEFEIAWMAAMEF